MDILEKIINHKKAEVAERISLYPTRLLEKSIYFDSTPVSMKKYITRDDKSGVIAEFKRRSPSKGDINQYASVEDTTIGYMQAGASALSILTDSEFFGGSNEDLIQARTYNFCPILRKDFIIDEYQIIEARSIGADAILLIAAALEPSKLRELAAFAKSLNLEVLMEVHSREELEANLHPEIDLIGVNNRNLKTFETSVELSKQLAKHIPDTFVKVSESGISQPELVVELQEYGYQGFLVGENFMKAGQPAQAAHTFILKVNQLKAQKV
jgi:indole-3-glycerol phosphate synthase